MATKSKICEKLSKNNQTGIKIIKNDCTNLWSKTSSDDIVRACHAFDAIAGQIRVRQIGSQKHRLSFRDFDVIEKVSDENADIAGEIGVQAKNEFCFDVFWAFGGDSSDEFADLSGNEIFWEIHQCRKSGFQS